MKMMLMMEEKGSRQFDQIDKEQIDSRGSGSLLDYLVVDMVPMSGDNGSMTIATCLSRGH